MSSNFSSSTTSLNLTQMSGILSSSVLSSSIFSSLPLSMEPSPSSLASLSSASLPPFPTPPPSSSPDFLPSSSSSSPESPSLSSPLSSESSFSSSVISVKGPFDVASSTDATSSGSGLPGALSASTTPVTTGRGTLRPVEVAAIGLGVVTAVLGIAAVLLVFCFRRRRHRHHPLYGLSYAEENKGLNKSSRSDVETRETPSGRSYFRSLSEQKGTTPLLHHSTPDNSELSHDELYRDTELFYNAISVQAPSPPPQSLSQHEILAHPTTMPNTTSTRPPRSPPPLQSQENSRQLLSLTIPEFPPKSTIHSSTPGSDALSGAESLAYADENGDMHGDSPSIYSQTSANALSRGPSVSSHVSVRRFSMPPTVLESILGGGSPIEENVRLAFDAGHQDGRTMPSETTTAATRGPLSSPPNPPVAEGPDSINTDPLPDTSQQPRHSPLNRNSGPQRQNTTAVASLLKSRQRQSELLPTAPSGVSHIERAGSIKPARGVETEGVPIRMSGESSGNDEREPYGRRFRRMKAEQGNLEMAT